MDKAGLNWPRCLSGQTLISASMLIKLTLAEGRSTKHEVSSPVKDRVTEDGDGRAVGAAENVKNYVF